MAEEGALRRSARRGENAANTSEPAADPPQATGDDATPATRRSRRQVKSTYASVAEPPPHAAAEAAKPSENADTGAALPAVASAAEEQKEALKSEEEERTARAKAIEDRINKRRRPQSHADSDSAAPMSPLASGSTFAAPSSANRRRRPAGRHASMDANDNGFGGVLPSSSTGVTPMGNADVSVRTQMQKALGKYTARECTLLCEVIFQQVKENSTLPGVLESDFSPAHIAWDRIAQKLLTLHRLSIRPRDAQELWKFLAYAEQPASTRKCKTQESVHGRDGTDEELLPASDDDDYDIPVDVINEKHKQNRPNLVGIPAMMELPENDDAREDEGIASDTTTKEADASEATEPQVVFNGPISPEEKAQSNETNFASEDKTKEKSGADASGDVVKASTQAVDNASSQYFRASPHDPSARLRLYPVYELPTGTPEGWQKPFQLKEMLPLTFVAGTFLKRKADALADPKAADGGMAAVAAAGAAMSATLAEDATEEKPKKKRGRKSTDAKSKETSEQQKKPKPTKAPTSAGTANASASTPRAPYVPPSTPPPQASPPRDAFHFFARMYEENPASVVDAPPQVAQQPTITDSSSVSRDVTMLQQLFATASASVRSKCEQLALDDLDRYNRECVRRRIWEKAMSSQTNTSIPSPANPTAQLTSANGTFAKSTVMSISGAAQIPGSTLISSAASVTINTAMPTAPMSETMRIPEH